MDEKLNELYQTMLNEGSNMTVGNVKPGDIDGGKKYGKPVKQATTGDNTVETPEEGLSSEEVKKGGATKNSETAGKVDTHESSKFDALFKSIVTEADMEDESSNEIVDAPEVEGDEFNDETGDFESTEETDVDSETDIATELRLMADRLSELADKMGVDLSGEEDLDLGGMEDEGMGEEDMGGEDMGGEDMDKKSFGESKEEESEGEDEDEDDEESVTEAKSEPEPKPAKATQFGPKMSKTAPGKLSKVSSKHSKGNIKGKYTGEPQKAKATQFGPKMSLKAKTSGPASKTNSDLF